MKKPEKNTEEYYVIDFRHVVRSLWKRAWIVVLVGVLVAAVAYSYAAYMIAPSYSSQIKLYINNNSNTDANTSLSVSSSQLSAAQALVRTYGEILSSRSTLEQIAEKAETNYSWRSLSSMISYAPCNNTEIMQVTVTCSDPYEASEIANAIAEVLPTRISDIINGASMKIVDTAIPQLTKVAPDITRYTTIGLVLGVAISAAILVVLALLDDTIHDEEYLLRTYDYPILGKVPDLLDTGSKSYGYYAQKKQK